MSDIWVGERGITEQKAELYPSALSYRIEDAEGLWKAVTAESKKYNPDFKGFIDTGPIVGNLGDVPKMRVRNGAIALVLEYGDTYRYKTLPNEQALSDNLSAILGKDIKFNGKAVYCHGRRIAVFGDKYSYEPTEKEDRINNAEELKNRLTEALEIYRVYVTEILKANEIKVPGDEIIIRPPYADVSNTYLGQSEFANLNIIPKEGLGVTFEDIGGQPGAVEISRTLARRLKFPGPFEYWASEPPRGILLEGPPGNGKTLLAKALAYEANAVFIFVRGSDISGTGLYGQAEKATAEIFEGAKLYSEKENKHVIIYIDEIDLIFPANVGGYRHEASGKMIAEVAQGMDGLIKNPRLTLIASTNDPRDLDPRILSRMAEQVHVGQPNLEGIKHIMGIKFRNKSKEANRRLFSETIDLEAASQVALKRKMSGRDLEDSINSLLSRYGNEQLNRILNAIESGKIPQTGSIENTVNVVMGWIREGIAENIPSDVLLVPVDTPNLIAALEHSKDILHAPDRPPIGFPGT